MDALDLFFKKYSYKFSKGYPDMNNKQDRILLESLLNELGVAIDIAEANLQGSATGYPGSLGAFEKYVQNNPKHNPDSPDDMMYQADKDTKLYDASSSSLSEKGEIKKGQEFKITIKDKKDVKSIGNSFYVNILFNDNEYLIRLSDIKKPTGKSVEKTNIDLSDKNNPEVFHDFVPGHPQEGQVAELFIKGTDENWGFKYDEKTYNVTYLGDPSWKGKGKPKSDIQVSLNGAPRPELGKDLKISLKASNAVFVENWVIPQRAIQIIDKDKLKKEFIDFHKTLLNSNPFKKETTAGNLAIFISTNPNSYKIDTGEETRGSYQLTPEEALEAYTGNNKFGEDSLGSANCFFKGKVPDSVEKFIKELKPFSTETIGTDLEELYLTIRGSNESRGGSLAFNKKEINGKPQFVIAQPWQEALGLTQSTNSQGQITYN